MTERFYDITHLTTDELRNLFTFYRKLGWIDFEFEELRPEDTPPTLSDAKIILNIQAGNEKNYFVFMLDHEDEEDGIMIGFGLTYHEDFSTYLHLPQKYLNALIEKYNLGEPKEAKNYTVTEYLIAEQLKYMQN